MKTYVLMVSKLFPQTHPKKGQPTYFPGKILDHLKIHTIRSNYELWAKRIQQVNNGEAVLSVRHWYDKPYRSPQIEFAQFEGDEVGIEKLDHPDNFIFAQIGEKQIDWGIVAKNDGLSFYDFCDWFKHRQSEPMAIIHFTDFRYVTQAAPCDRN